MAQVGDLTAKLTLDTSGFSKGAEDALGMAKNLAGGMGKALGAVGTAVAGAVAAAGAGVVKMVTDATKAYADYEQLVGGVETLFKDSAGIVQDYAMEAYKTAGISANQYMETVTSFSASLLQSLGGDTAKAAEMSNMAITDMADNANKMGSSMESIQNAYQGFAKQNYTMLDNLKLGYGGTQEEMYRLLSDAAKLNDEFARTAKFSIDSKGHLIAGFADIAQAIHIVQTEMGITGTTAKEASTTISGSFNMVKASWGDLLTSIAGGGKGLHEAVAAFVDSVRTFAENLIPVIQEALYGIGDLITELAPVIMDAVPELIANVLPGLIDAAVGLVMSIIDALPEILAVLSAAIPDIVTQLMAVVSDLLMMLMTTGLPMLLELAINIVMAVAQGLVDNLPTLIPAMVQMVGVMVNTIVDHLPEFLAMGVKIVFAIIEGIVMAIPNFIMAIGELLGIVDSSESHVNDAASRIESTLGTTQSSVKTMTTGITDMTKKTEDSVSSSSNTMMKGLIKQEIQLKDSMGNVQGTITQFADGTSWVVKDNMKYIKDETGKTIETVQLNADTMKDLSTTAESQVSGDMNSISSEAESAAASVEAAVDRINSALGNIASVNVDIPGRAGGGDITAGHPYIVGELGPELIIPSTSGHVYTAEETEGMLSGGTGDGITIVIQGDVYDDERSMKQKLRNAMTSVLEEQVAYGW